MPLNAREAFKVGFLARCVEDGLSPDEMLDRVKFAAELLEKRAGIISTLGGKLADVGQGIGSAALGYGLPLALAAPPILGGVAGYGLARATDIDDTDIDDVKDREVMDEYVRQTARLKRQRAARDYQKAKQQTGRIFM